MTPEGAKASEAVILVDAFAQIFRSFYAVRALTNSKGVCTNAVFAMTKFLLSMADGYATKRGAFVFDSGRPPHRMALAPDYKANRAPMPEELKQQMGAIKDLISAFGWETIICENWEADDLIACIASTEKDDDILIVSADKDLSQLIDGRVRMLVPDREGKGLALRGERETLEKFGVPPSMILDYLSLIGDSSDNIPGIDGVGPKTAAALLTKFGSIDAMLERASEIERETLRNKIVSGAERLKINQELVRLVATPPEEVLPFTLERKAPDYGKILSIAREAELKSLYADLEKRAEGGGLFDVRNADAAGKNAPQKSVEEDKGMEQLELF